MVGDRGASRALSRGWLAGAAVGAAFMAAAAIAFIGTGGAGRSRAAAATTAPAALAATSAPAVLATTSAQAAPHYFTNRRAARVVPATAGSRPCRHAHGPLATGHTKADRDVRFVQPPPQPAVRAEPTGELWDTRK